MNSSRLEFPNKTALQWADFFQNEIFVIKHAHLPQHDLDKFIFAEKKTTRKHEATSKRWHEIRMQWALNIHTYINVQLEQEEEENKADVQRTDLKKIIHVRWKSFDRRFDENFASPLIEYSFD